MIEKTRREPVGKLVYNGYILAHDGQKMSKSKGNVVNPDDLIEQGYGADSVRLFEMFIAPYDQNTSWNINGVPGTFRFLQRVWHLAQEVESRKPKVESQGEPEAAGKPVLRIAHRAIKRVSHDLENLSFNTAVAAMMEAVNDLYAQRTQVPFEAAPQAWHWATMTLLQLLAPFAPHMTEELWHQLGREGSIHLSVWPQHDESLLTTDHMTIAVQINGKLRAELTVPQGASEQDVISAAQSHERVKPYVEGAPVKKTIYVPSKILNFVV